MHAERVEVNFQAELLKLKGIVALMAIKDEQPTRANYLTLCLLDDVLYPLNSYLFGRPAVVADNDSPVAWEFLFVPGREVVMAGKDDRRWDSPDSSLDSLDNHRPLAIAGLDILWPGRMLD